MLSSSFGQLSSLVIRYSIVNSHLNFELCVGVEVGMNIEYWWGDENHEIAVSDSG